MTDHESREFHIYFNNLSQFLVIVCALIFVTDKLCLANVKPPPNRQLVIGHATNFAPYSFVDDNGHGAGYNVELSREIVRVMQLDAEIRMGSWGELRKAMENGEIDALAMFYSVERDKQFDFSSRFSIVHNAIFIRRDMLTIQTEDDLRDKNIIVISGDIMHDYVVEKGITDNLTLVSTEAKALRLLASGKHDLALVAQLPGLYWANKLKLSNIITVGPLLRPSETAYAVVKGNVLLQQQLSEGMAVLQQTGVLKKVHDKWFGILVSEGISLGMIWKYLALIGIPVLLILAGFILWSRILHRLVAQRTEELSAEISHHKKVKQALTYEKNNLMSIFQAMTDGVYIVNQDYEIKYVNPVLIKEFGNNTEKKSYQYFNDRIDVCPWCPNAEVNLGNTVHWEWSSPKNQKTYDLIATPLTDPEGSILTLEIFRDITERKQAELKLKEQLDELQCWKNAMQGRVGREMELKSEVNALLIQSGQTIRYQSVEESGKSHD